MQHDTSRTRPDQGARPESQQTSVDDTTVQLAFGGVAEARQRRDDGTAVADHAADVVIRRALADAIEARATTGHTFTSDDIHADVGPVLDAWPQLLGARFNAAAKAGLIVRVGYRQSTRPSRHAAVIAMWQGVEQAQERAA